MSETIIQTTEEFKSRIEECSKIDKQNGIKYNVIRDNLSPSCDKNYKYNYMCFLDDRQFYHMNYGYLPWPPGVYFSEDIDFMKSTLHFFTEICNDNKKKISNMSLSEFIKTLKEKTDDDSQVRKHAKKEYIVRLEKRWKGKRECKLKDIAMKDDFFYEGLVLFCILPEYFIKVY